jgi:hypothetical protein
MEGEPPIALMRRLEEALAGEAPDQIIFAMGLVLGRVIAYFALAEDHEEVVDACVEAIGVGIRESESLPHDRH